MLPLTFGVVHTLYHIAHCIRAAADLYKTFLRTVLLSTGRTRVTCLPYEEGKVVVQPTYRVVREAGLFDLPSGRLQQNYTFALLNRVALSRRGSGLPPVSLRTCAMKREEK